MSVARIPFSSEDESAISGLGQWMLVVAIIHFVIGGLLLLCLGFGCLGIPALFQVASPLVAGLQVVRLAIGLLAAPVLIAQGAFLMQARKAFDAVVASDSADQAFLGEAFGRVRLFFLIEVIYGLLQLVIVFIDILLPIVVRFL